MNFSQVMGIGKKSQSWQESEFSGCRAGIGSPSAESGSSGSRENHISGRYEDGYEYFPGVSLGHAP